MESDDEWIMENKNFTYGKILLEWISMIIWKLEEEVCLPKVKERK